MTKANIGWEHTLYLTVVQVAIMLGISRSGIYAKLKEHGPGSDPTFPRPRKFGPGMVRFSKAEVMEWANSRSTVGEVAA